MKDQNITCEGLQLYENGEKMCKYTGDDCMFDETEPDYNKCHEMYGISNSKPDKLYTNDVDIIYDEIFDDGEE